MSTLQIQLFGDFRIVRGDDESLVGISSPRLQSLFAYLLLHSSAPQPRRHLAFVLWPDSSEAQARTNLRKLVHELRRELPDADLFLQSDQQTLSLRPTAPCTIDVTQFEHAVAKAATRHALEHAASLYRGDLLPNCYDDWILSDRERLKSMFRQCLEKLMTHLEGERAFSAAIVYAQRLLRQDPLVEEPYRRLMRLHALTGDRAGVVRVYKTCAMTLERELGVRPSQETRRAYDEYLAMPAAFRNADPSISRRASSGASPRNWPIPLTSFIGREREKADVKELLSEHRLVTLIGSGGVGKTRLGLAVASEVRKDYRDSVCWLDLAPLREPALLLQEMASALGVHELPGHPLLDTIVSRVHDKHILLVMDNCEHLVEEVGNPLETLLHSAPHLRVLITSRESLRVAGELTWRVPSLAVPMASPRASEDITDQPATLLRYPSVRLFVDRAAAVLPTFALTRENASAIASICARLDGIPLAIELAAARIKLLTVDQIAERLDDCFRLLKGGSRTALPRHQTLRGTMDWSYALLAEKEQILLRRLSVFAGGFTLQAAEAVAGQGGILPHEVLDLLSSLLDKSLVEVERRDDGTRNRLLETVRQYAQEKLIQSGEADAVKARHLNYFMGLAERASPGWLGYEQPVWLMRLIPEHDNLRAALEWSAANQTTAPIGLELVGVVAPFLEVQGYFPEECRWIDQLLERAGAAASPAQRAVVYEHAIMAKLNVGPFHAAQAFGWQAVALFRELGDQQHLAESLYFLGMLYLSQTRFAEARPVLEEGLSICRERGDWVGASWCLGDLGTVVDALGEHDLGHAYLEQGLELARQGKPGLVLGRLAYLLGNVCRLERNSSRAKSLYKEALTAAEPGVIWSLPYYVEGLGFLLLEEGAALRAATLLGAGDFYMETWGLTRVPLLQSDFDRAMVALRAACDEQALAVTWAKGRAMTMEQVVAYALDERVSSPS